MWNLSVLMDYVGFYVYNFLCAVNGFVHAVNL